MIGWKRKGIYEAGILFFKFLCCVRCVKRSRMGDEGEKSGDKVAVASDSNEASESQIPVDKSPKIDAEASPKVPAEESLKVPAEELSGAEESESRASDNITPKTGTLSTSHQFTFRL